MFLLILGAKTVVTASTVSSVVTLIVSILLIVGAVRNKPALLIPFVVFTVIGTILFVVMVIAVLVLLKDTVARIVLSCIFIVCLPLAIYFCLVVIGLYKQQKAEKQSIKRLSYQANCERLVSFAS
jgi:tryptophan-rich sensory protein